MTTINRASFEKLVAEDIAWLESQPGEDGPSTEKGHTLMILKQASKLYYEQRDTLHKILQAWHDPNLDSSETAAEMATIAQQALGE